MQYNYRTTGGVLLGTGILLLLLTVLDSLGILSQREVLPSPEDFWASLTFVGLGFMALLGRTISSLKGHFKDVEIDVHFESVVPQKVLDPELKEKRQEYAASRYSVLPDRDAPSFQLLEERWRSRPRLAQIRRSPCICWTAISASSIGTARSACALIELWKAGEV